MCVSIGVLVLLFLLHPLLMDPCQLVLCQHHVTDTKKWKHCNANRSASVVLQTLLFFSLTKTSQTCYQVVGLEYNNKCTCFKSQPSQIL